MFFSRRSSNVKGVDLGPEIERRTKPHSSFGVKKNMLIILSSLSLICCCPKKWNMKKRQKTALIALRKAEQTQALEALAKVLDLAEHLKVSLFNVKNEIIAVKNRSLSPPVSSLATCLESDSLARQVAFKKLKILQNTCADLEENLRIARIEIDNAQNSVQNTARALDAVKKLT